MSKSKSAEHWKTLAILLGVEPPEDEEEELKDVEGAADEDQRPAPVVERDTEASPDSNEGSEAKSPVDRAVAASSPPTSKSTTESPDVSMNHSTARRSLDRHWGELAASLGLEVTPSDLELEPEGSTDEPLTDSSDEQVEPVASPDADDADEEQSAESLPEAAQADSAVTDQAAALDQESEKPTSLFEDPNLRLDEPGVLDVIFGNCDPDRETPAQPQRQPRPPFDVDDDEGDSIGDRDSIKEDEVGDQLVLDKSLDDEQDTGVGTEHRRRRRRGRGRRKRERSADNAPDTPTTPDSKSEGRFEATADAGPAADALAGETAETAADAEAAAQVDAAEPQEVSPEMDEPKASKTGDERSKRKRKRRSRRSRKEAAETENGAEEDHSADQLPSTSKQEAEDDAGIDKATTAGSGRTKGKHRKIPTWEEAISVVIAANADNHARNGGRRGRGRGRGRARK